MIKRLSVVGVVLGLACGPASAIQIFALDANGNEAGGPLATTWSVYSGTPTGGASATDVSGGSQTDWAVKVGLNEFGSLEGGSQLQGIYGAGTTLTGAAGYSVHFRFDGFTWDSYDSPNTPLPNGGSNGYWDLFAVNINTSKYYWDLVNGGTGAQGDPMVTPDPAGSPVTSLNNPLAGNTWGFGGLDFGNGTVEQDHNNYVIKLMGTPGSTSDTFYISAILDTASTPDSDTAYPSWGAYNCDGCVPPPIPEPGTIALLGLGLVALRLRSRRPA